MSLVLQVFYSVFSALMLSLAIPNELYLLGCPFYALFAIIPFYYVISNARRFRNAFWMAFLQTITVHLCSSFWLGFFKDFAAFTLGASALGTGLIGGAFGLFFYVPYHTKSQKNPLDTYSLSNVLRVPSRILYFAVIYVLYEWYKSIGFLGYPWGTVSSAVYRWPVLMQISSITGTYGITFLIILFSALIAEGFSLIPVLAKCESETGKRIYDGYFCITKTWAILLAFSILFGLYQTKMDRKPDKYLKTVIVQQNSDPWKQVTDTQDILTSMDLTDKVLADIDEKPDLIVWSEGVLKRAFPEARFVYESRPSTEPLIDYIKKINVPFIIGGPYQKEDYKGIHHFYNSALTFDETGKFRGYYAKNHLVPFAETIPFSEYKPIYNFLQNVIGISAGWTAGDQYTYFEIPSEYSPFHQEGAVKSIDLSKSYGQQYIEERTAPLTKISTPICFDDAFTDVCRPLWKNGSEVFINLTDDSWSLKKSSEFQHFCIAAYRAIEYRTTLVRSTNAGYSVVVDPTGKVIADMPLFETDALYYKVPVYKRQWTTYSLLGNWLPWSFCILCLAYYAYLILTFEENDYIPSERKIKKNKKKYKQGKHHKDKKHHHAK